MSESTQVNDNYNGLSKSQKKRLKRNASKKKNAQKISEIPDDSLNPTDRVRAALVKQGFELTFIDEGLDEMWNAQLDYSDYDAALVYLLEKKGRDDTADSQLDLEIPTSVDEGVNTSIQPNVEASNEVEHQEEAIPTKTDSKSTASTASSLESATNKESSTKEIVSERASPKDTTLYAQPVVTAKKSKSSDGKKKKVHKNQPEASLHSKLEIVANHESLNDAITALTEWIVKSATKSELKEFCTGSKACALRTVIYRSIAEKKVESNLGQILDLFGSILRAAGLPTNQLSASAKALGLVLKRAVDATKCEEALFENVATTVAVDVAQMLSNAIEKIEAHSLSGSQMIRQLESEIESLSSSIVPKAGLKELVMNRDSIKLAAEKSSRVVKISMNALFVSNETKSISEDSKTNEEAMMSMLGDKFYEVTSSKTEYQDLVRIQGEKGGKFPERENLIASIRQCEIDKETVIDKMNELENQMRELSAKEKSLNIELETKNCRLSSLEDSMSGESREVELRIQNASEKMKIGSSVSMVANQLNELGCCLSQACSSIASSTDAESNDEDFTQTGRKVEQYIRQMKAYFVTESDFMIQLQERAFSIEKKIPGIEREINELRALGMKSNVAEMAKNLDSLRKNASDDSAIVEALRTDAVNMKADLIQRLSQYNDIIVHRSETIPTSFKPSLADLQSVVVKMNLPQDEVFHSIMKTFGISNQNAVNVDVGVDTASKPKIESVKPLNGMPMNRKTWGKVN